MNKYLQPQIKALKLAISCLEDHRRKNFAVAHAAYSQGIRPDDIKGNGITGVGFAWVTEGEAHYQEYIDAIRQLQDMIEIITDPGVFVVAAQPDLFSNLGKDISL